MSSTEIGIILQMIGVVVTVLTLLDFIRPHLTEDVSNEFSARGRELTAEFIRGGSLYAVTAFAAFMWRTFLGHPGVGDRVLANLFTAIPLVLYVAWFGRTVWPPKRWPDGPVGYPLLPFTFFAWNLAAVFVMFVALPVLALLAGMVLIGWILRDSIIARSFVLALALAATLFGLTLQLLSAS